ncbi:MAG: hypothetical protein NWF06_10870 [Candidatus Bathyarchaeota archaeon]|nr:hypothetical protein [Candidatus Bathyarchaeum sp.]
MDDLLTVSLASLAVLLVSALILVLVLQKNREHKGAKEPNYQIFFWIGVAFVPMGLVFVLLSFTSGFPLYVGIPFIGIGLMFLLIGWSKRK